MGSFLSCAVSTNILRGPFGHNTATKSVNKRNVQDLKLLLVTINSILRTPLQSKLQKY